MVVEIEESDLREVLKWVKDCKDQILYSVAVRNELLGATAEGLGQTSVDLISKMQGALNRLATVQPSTRWPNSEMHDIVQCPSCHLDIRVPK